MQEEPDVFEQVECAGGRGTLVHLLLVLRLMRVDAFQNTQASVEHRTKMQTQFGIAETNTRGNHAITSTTRVQGWNKEGLQLTKHVFSIVKLLRQCVLMNTTQVVVGQ